MSIGFEWLDNRHLNKKNTLPKKKKKILSPQISSFIVKEK